MVTFCPLIGASVVHVRWLPSMLPLLMDDVPSVDVTFPVNDVPFWVITAVTVIGPDGAFTVRSQLPLIAPASSGAAPGSGAPGLAPPLRPPGPFAAGGGGGSTAYRMPST